MIGLLGVKRTPAVRALEGSPVTGPFLDRL